MHEIVSVPVQLSTDHATILSFAQQSRGVITNSMVAQHTGWTKTRCQVALDVLLQEQLAWIDLQTNEPTYYFPSLFLSTALA